MLYKHVCVCALRLHVERHVCSTIANDGSWLLVYTLEFLKWLPQPASQFQIFRLSAIYSTVL